MPRSTHENRVAALRGLLREWNEPGSDHQAVLPAEHEQATWTLSHLAAGGWHLIHADDLPAGYHPGDAIPGTTTRQTNEPWADHLSLSERTTRLEHQVASAFRMLQALDHNDTSMIEHLRTFHAGAEPLDEQRRRLPDTRPLPRYTAGQPCIAHGCDQNAADESGYCNDHPAYQDDDQRPGGHDNPHPTHEEQA